MLGISSILGVTLTARFYDDAAEAAMSGRDLHRFIEAARAANAISAERGPTNSAVAAPADAPGPMSSLAASRARTDAALAEVERNGVLAKDAAPVRASLLAVRAFVDGLTARPRDARTAADVQQVVDLMFAVADAAQTLPELGLRPIARRPESPAAYPAMMILMASSLRDYAGRMGSVLMVPLATAKPMTEDQRTAFHLVEGRVMELRRLIGQTPGTDSGMTSDALRQVEVSFFGDGMASYRRVLEAGHDGRYPWDRGSFTQRLMAPFATLEHLRDAFADGASDAMDRRARHARWAFWTVAAVTGLMVSLECVLLVAARRLIFSPLLKARDCVLALAMNTSEAQTASPAEGEVGDLFAALRLLQKRLSERDAVDQRNVVLNEQLRRLADTDALTGQLNRGALERIVSVWLEDRAETGPIGLILFDLDHFKSINDTFGHTAGDAVLRGIAERLSDLVPPGCVLARFGGEEFAIVMPEAAPNAAVTIAEQLRRALLAPMPLPTGAVIPVTASFGCATGARRQDLWLDLVEAADAALYRAKAAGRNRVAWAGDTAETITLTAA